MLLPQGQHLAPHPEPSLLQRYQQHEQPPGIDVARSRPFVNCAGIYSSSSYSFVQYLARKRLVREGYGCCELRCAVYDTSKMVGNGHTYSG